MNRSITAGRLSSGTAGLRGTAQKGAAHMDDQTIIDLYWRRDETAVTVTQAKYGPYCYRIAANILADSQDAEECVNDTWLGAWNAMPPHRPALLRAFLGKITRNLAVDAVRFHSAQKRGGGAYLAALEELTDCVPAVPGADRTVEDRELTEILNRFLRTLSERDCNVFLRRYWYAESLEAIARRYELRENTVRTCLFRTRNKLRKYLEKEGISV